MKNKLVDLNNHLFCQLERLNDESLSAEGLQDEVKKAQVMANIAEKVISNGRLILDSHKAQDMLVDARLPDILTSAT